MLKSFILEHCEMSPDYRVTKTDFYEAYCHCERSHGRQPNHINEVGRQMKELDFGEVRTKNTRFWLGVQLVSHDVTALSEAKSVPSIPVAAQSNSTHGASNIEEALNERLRQEMTGVCTYQKF